MNVVDLVYFISFFGFIAISGYKLYNIFNVGQKYGYQGMWLLFIGSMISYFICFSVVMTDTSQLFYSISFNLLRLLMPLNVIFLAIEYIIALRLFVPGQPMQNSLKMRESSK